MDYIEKLELQTEEVEEIETLEKHTIINSGSVNKYNGHTREFLALDGDYDDGFNQLKETDGLGISCIVSKEVKEARKDVNGNYHTTLKDRIDSEVNKKVNKNELESEVVSRRVRGQNNVDSPAGVFDFANFAQQGKSGIASLPIGGVIHHYTDGKVLQIDNVGENNVIVTMVNANNTVRRPDKADTFFGSGYYLQLMTNNQNIGQVISHFVIDEKANFFWNGTSRTGEKTQSTKLTNAKEYGYTPAFIFETVNKHEDMIHFKNGDRVFMIIADNNAVNCAEIKSSNVSDGMNIKAIKGDIRISPAEGKNVRISNNVYINKQDGRGPKEVAVIDFGTTSERPTTNLECGMMYFDRTLNKPIWRNKDNNGWVDAMGTSV